MESSLTVGNGVSSAVNFSQQFPQIESFLETITPLLPGYQQGLLSYVAVVHGGDTVILRACLRLLSPSSGRPPPSSVHTLSLRAGHVSVAKESITTIEPWIRAAVLGDCLPVVNPKLKLLPDQSPPFSAYHEGNLPLYGGTAKDVERLQIDGANRYLFMGSRRKDLDRELHEVGLESIHGLLRAFWLEPSDRTAFEVSAAKVASIETATLLGARLQIVTRLSHGLDKENFRITVRSADPNHTDLPRSFGASEMEWEDTDDSWVGSLTSDLPFSAVVVCRAVYAGRLQDESRVSDPKALPNRRRMTMNVFDPELKKIGKTLRSPTDKQRDDFETATGILFQLLGFSPAPVGKLSGMSGEPDLIAEGPDGEILIVECTTDVPDDDKLMKLVSRSVRVREELARSTHPDTSRVLSLLVVPVPDDELRPIRQKATDHGVIILCKSNIEDGIARTEFAPNPREVLEHWCSLPLIGVLIRGLD